MFAACYLNSAEYAKIVSEINTNYDKYKGKRLAVHYSVYNDTYYSYYFENLYYDN